jgi:SSS family solute:Na+ symporter
MHLSLTDYFIFLLLLALGYLAPYIMRFVLEFKFMSHGRALLETRRITAPMFILSMVSTWYGGILGVTQLSFETGIYNFITQGVFWYVAYLFYAFYLAPKISHGHIQSLPDWCEKKWGIGSKTPAALLTLINCLPFAYFFSLILSFKFIFNFNHQTASLITIALLVPAIFFFKTFKDQIFSDAYQTILMLVGLLTTTMICMYHYGSPVELWKSLPLSHTSVSSTHSYLDIASWSIIALTTVIDPAFHERTSLSQSPASARNGLLGCIIFWFIIDVCTTLGGLYAFANLPQGTSSEISYILMADSILPVGVKGLFCFTLFVTIYSTLDSYIYLSVKTLKEHLLVKHPHWQCTLLVLFFLTIFSFSWESSIANIWLVIGGLSSSCLLTPFLLGHLTNYVWPLKTFAKMTLLSVLFYALCYMINVEEQSHIPLLFWGIGFNALGYLIIQLNIRRTHAQNY